MNKKIAIVILNCTIIFLAGTFDTFGQENISELKDKKITIKMHNQPLGKVFRELMVKYDVAIGFEESTLDREHNDYEFEAILPGKPKQKVINMSGEVRISIKTELVFNVEQHWLTIDAENKRLEDVLNIIVGQMENYKWEINDDVVNIFPVKGRDKRYEELLKLNIKNYRLKKGEPIGLIRNEIFALPEVTKFLSDNEIYSSWLRLDPEYIRRPLTAELDFSNLTLKDLLNKITKVKRGGWILKQNKIFRKQEKEYIEISI